MPASSGCLGRGVAEKLDELKLRFNSSRTFFIPRFSNATWAGKGTPMEQLAEQQQTRLQ
ncbi:hypothetical protein J5X98_01305 [Leptothermofonsia sichuanensis E412]|uniref:hypothetical protein n=1 Tax=Leptothermofonsia sichuanensis TaxID=2917832 RepID=UPI001CA67F94|nr:hypothetical protein [Leptothermofonsia sichuanensis]QZZ21173.1 hypothetical protein J5X98_01305 [Leptothermofonsia sichuanensis E412]